MDNSSDNLDHLAIEAALSYNWEEAIKLNKEIIKDTPEDTDSLNRLARAYFEMGKFTQAKKIYQQVLELDPYNVIAQKNLKKVASFKKDSKDGVANHDGIRPHISPALFLEEAGVTKVISLLKLAEPQKLSILSPGELVTLTLKNRGITVADERNNYLGVLPDDLSHHLIRLISGGNKYQCLIKSVKPNSLSILIREIFRAKKFKNQPSFIGDAKAVSYSSDHITISDDDDAPTSEGSESDEGFTV